ncbi:MAG: hypothetical protein L6Q95_14725, partial [Planctomycetes bacterium]|nr:hypothetical protein [Planctomycetota bacterium]
LRLLLEEGRRFGFDADAEWWGRRAAWAAERILVLDPDDLEANELAGRRTLQSIDAFEATWRRIVETRAPTEQMIELLDRYGPWVEEGRPVFLTQQEFEVERARLGEAALHLDRLEADPSYAAEQRALLHAKASVHADYPFVHVRVGPFLVFYAARDLARDPEADPAEEEARLAGRREVRLKRLADWTGVYAELVDDLRTLFPGTLEAHPLDAHELLPQWVFEDREWYQDLVARLHRTEAEQPYRLGFLHEASGWAYLAEPADANAMDLFRETAAYLGALQILRGSARDPKDPTINHWTRSEDYWFKEGLPALLASRRVKTPIEGQALRGPWEMPRLDMVVGRRGRLGRWEHLSIQEDVEVPGEPMLLPDGGFTDLAWLLVRHLEKERRPQLERFLRAQIEGTGKGILFFEECFEVKGSEAWRALQRATYASIE